MPEKECPAPRSGGIRAGLIKDEHHDDTQLAEITQQQSPWVVARVQVPAPARQIQPRHLEHLRDRSAADCRALADVVLDLYEIGTSDATYLAARVQFVLEHLVEYRDEFADRLNKLYS